ncbi:nucleotidyltransferase family protein [Georgenia subflava]|uniref:nucleotidyltransferase family protein n=1 Tax=Georgenia subflava TaxID=1622177 RepID=UPI00186B3C79|nr:nucleotidyltransferase family protein [Georgenia subflava]
MTIARGGGSVNPSDEPEAVIDLVLAARHHRVAPLLHRAVRGSAPAIAALVEPDRRLAIGHHLGATLMLEEFAAVAGSLPWVTFKGPVLSELAHPVPGMRTYNDVDLLVDPRDLREITNRLLDAGWTVGDYQDMLRNPDTPGEMHWFSPTGLAVDLHWSMINMAVRRAQFAVSTEELLARRVQVTLGLNRAWTMDAADALVHICLHAALTGANRLLLLVDADRMAARVDDWDDVARRARAWRAAPHVALVLARARRVLGTPLPANLPRMLGATRPFRILTAALDLAAPVPAARQEAGPARLVARAVQPWAARTVVASGRSSARALRERLGAPTTRPPRERLPADLESLSVYLAGVESSTRG